MALLIKGGALTQDNVQLPYTIYTTIWTARHRQLAVNISCVKAAVKRRAFATVFTQLMY